jgi:hypothetical protein
LPEAGKLGLLIGGGEKVLELAAVVVAAAADPRALLPRRLALQLFYFLFCACVTKRNLERIQHKVLK